MKYYPIIFNSEMVKAILEGRKTQTRRVVKPQPESIDLKTNKTIPYNGTSEFLLSKLKCPYGQPGDILWVREIWATGHDMYIYRPPNYVYRADYKYIAESQATRKPVKWKSSIHMPRRVSRITLEITDVRVERLNEIKYEDILNEGWDVKHSQPFSDRTAGEDARDWFRILWNSIYKKEHRWEDNDWVWVVSFKRVGR